MAGTLTLSPASSSTIGGVKIGANITVTEDGTISTHAPTPAYSLPTATAEVLGGVKIGNGINISNGVISVDVDYIAQAIAGTGLKYVASA